MQNDWRLWLQQARLYAIIDTGYLRERSVTFYAKELVKGGAHVIQLRAKKESLQQVEAMAKAIHEITQEAKIPLILNDYVELAAKLNLEGVHVGQEDMPLHEVRKKMPVPAVLGKSTHSLNQAITAQEEKPDYIGFGPLFATPTKPAYQPIGLDLIQNVHQQVDIPIFCIGGVKLENLKTILQAGAKRVVAVSGIMQAASPSDYCLQLNETLSRFPLSS
ncbi:MAG: thiamine phosphate synthase [Verrucomicrobiae bacterium]|nr:thiamine phosphate synthase [Verrucomicrobiae bacterium]